jgi:uncharacterized protein
MNILEPTPIELVACIARALVDNPEEVFVRETTAGEVTTVSLAVNPEDIQKIIGKSGLMARSIRTILRDVGVKLKHRYSLEIIEEVNRFGYR